MHLDECNICGKCLIFIDFFIDFFIPIYSDLLKKDREIAALKAEKIKQLEVEERAGG